MWAEEVHLFLRLKVGDCFNFLRLLRCLGENDTNDLFILGWLFFFLFEGVAIDTFILGVTH